MAREHVHVSTAYNEIRPVGKHCSIQESGLRQGSTVYTERAAIGEALFFVQESASGGGTGARPKTYGFSDMRPVREHFFGQESGLWQGSTVYTERAAMKGPLLCTRERGGGTGARTWEHVLC